MILGEANLITFLNIVASLLIRGRKFRKLGKKEKLFKVAKVTYRHYTINTIASIRKALIFSIIEDIVFDERQFVDV